MAIPAAFDPWIAALGSQPTLDRAKSSNTKAAQQFEALLIRQFLANARSTSWLSDQHESESGWREIADDALAGYLAKSGGMGLAKQIESLLSQANAKTASAGNPVTQFLSKDSSVGRLPGPLNESARTTVK
ncbi:MAG: hypothetical protein EBV01_13410 [Betaproteobacteria bacterium]|nr:hypothetical protein [Betaproteobacteria bacterium]NBP40671.1 hypothetical protein [Betaproteobacteria bacterium]NBQ79771.1 hypothetical protein [Betaproteobacteria bacterium]NBS40395.1 hypothetical protein [Betaproteobacteria bacterium]NCV15508.1 hypothetical protein [Betaproteobacteria bacterium]